MSYTVLRPISMGLVLQENLMWFRNHPHPCGLCGPFTRDKQSLCFTRIYWCHPSVRMHTVIKYSTQVAVMYGVNPFFSLCFLCLRAGDGWSWRHCLFGFSVHSILVNRIFQERLRGIFSSLTQISTRTHWWADKILVVRSQRWRSPQPCLSHSREHNISRTPWGKILAQTSTLSQGWTD